MIFVMKLLLMEPVSIWLGDIYTLLGHVFGTCQAQSKASVLCQHLFQEQLTDVLSGTGECLAQQPKLCVCLYVQNHTLMMFFHDYMIVHWNMIMYRQMNFCHDHMLYKTGLLTEVQVRGSKATVPLSTNQFYGAYDHGFCAWWLIVLWGQMYILGCFKQELLADNHRSYWVC